MASAQNKDKKPQPQNPVIIADDVDHSILQQPLNLGIKNVKQILKCIDSGSREVKDIILNECNIIYECKVCLNLFRSLANLLYHKRAFCKDHLCEDMLLFESFNETECEVVQPQPVENEKIQDVPMDTDQTATDAEETTDKAVDVENKILLNGDENGIATSDGSEKSNDNESEMANDESGGVNDDKSGSIPVIKAESTSDDDVIIVDDDSDVEKKVKKEEKVCSTNGGHDSDIEMLVLTSKSPKENINKSINQAEETVINGQGKKLPANVIPIIFKPIPGNKNALFQVINKDSIGPCSIKVGNTSESVQLNTTSADQKKLIIVVPNNQSVKKTISPVKAHESVVLKNCESETLKSCASENAASSISPEKPKDLHLTRRKRLLNRSDCNVQSLKCLKCGTHFTTLKTLYFHMMSFHSHKRMYFPCPYCKSLFVQMYGVTRHLIQIHGKTKEQINNRMRDAIRKTAVWRRVNPTNSNEDTVESSEKETDEKTGSLKEKQKEEEVEAKKKSSDLKSLDRKIMHSYVRVENNVTLHHCSKCRRVFARKSSQVSHEKFCIMNSPNKSESSNRSPISESPSPTKSDSPVVEKQSPIEIKPHVRPKRGAEKQMHKDFVDSQTLKWRSANRIETVSIASPSTTAAPVPAKKKPSKAHEKKIMSLVDSEKLLCLKCGRKFSSFSNLRRHAAIHIGWTRFKCRCCDYQSYNKSDIIHHIQRMHTPVPEEDLPKFVINLLADHSANKVSIPKVAKPSKANSTEPKKGLPARRKKILPKKVVEGRRKSHSPPKHKTSHLDAKILYQKSLPIDNKRKKSVKANLQSKYDSHPVKKQPHSYRSVTTNSPTTIILSKTNSIVQNSASTTSPTLNNGSNSCEKALPTRISPRKFETGLKVIKSPTASGYETAAIMHRKSSIVKIKVSTESSFNKPNSASPDRNSSKKNRTISDWFVRKSSPEIIASSAPRREAGPVIIDLVPASNVSRSKNASLSSK